MSDYTLIDMHDVIRMREDNNLVMCIQQSTLTQDSVSTNAHLYISIFSNYLDYDRN